MGAAAFQRRSVMEQSTLPISRNVSLERLVNDALGEIERLGYSRRSRNRYRTTWEHLIEFSCRKGLGDQFSSELAVRFLEEYRLTGDEIETTRKCGNATAADHYRSSVHEVLVANWLSRVCARLDIECSEIDVC